jgi:ribosome maturation factor RimP
LYRKKVKEGTKSPFLLGLMKELIEKILTEKTAGSHLFLVNTDVKKNRIEVFIDGDCGVNINECASLNHFLHKSLEEMNVDTGNFIVEISSPGFDRDLNDPRSLKKNVGRKVQVRNSQGKYLKGKLILVDENGIVLAQGAKKDLVRYQDIKEAKVVI